MILLDNDIAIQYLDRFREDHNLKGYELAEHFNISPQMVSHMLNGSRNIPKRIIRILAEEYPDMDVENPFGSYIYHFPAHAKSLDTYETKYRIPSITEPAYSFVCLNDIRNTCQVGDVIITQMELTDEYLSNDLLVQFNKRPVAIKGKDTDDPGYKAIAVIRMK